MAVYLHQKNTKVAGRNFFFLIKLRPLILEQLFIRNKQTQNSILHRGSRLQKKELCSLQRVYIF